MNYVHDYEELSENKTNKNNWSILTDCYFLSCIYKLRSYTRSLDMSAVMLLQVADK